MSISFMSIHIWGMLIIASLSSMFHHVQKKRSTVTVPSVSMCQGAKSYGR